MEGMGKGFTVTQLMWEAAQRASILREESYTSYMFNAQQIY